MDVNAIKPADPAFLAWRAEPTPSSLRRLLLANQDRVYSLCFQVLRHEQDAQDAAQASLLEIARGVRNLEEPRAFSSWLYRVCLNNALNQMRERRRRRSREERSAAMKPVADSPEVDQIRDAVHEALAELEDDERALVVEHYFEKRTLDELGARRGVTGVAIWKRIEQAKERMKRSLAAAGLAVGGPHVNSVLEAAEFKAAPPGFTVEAALGAPGTAVSTSVSLRIVAGMAVLVVIAMLTAFLTRSNPETPPPVVATSPPPAPLAPATPPEPPLVVTPPPPEETQDETVRVLTPDGKPLQGVLVFPGRWYRLRGDDVFDPFRPETIKDGVVTDEEGRFSMSTKRPFVTAWHPEFSPTTVPAGSVAPLRLLPRGRIRGKLVDAGGKPVEGVDVMLDKRGPKATTGPTGAFEFEHVSAGIRGLLLPERRRIAVRIDPGETVDVRIDPGLEVQLDLSRHPLGLDPRGDGAFIGTGKISSLFTAKRAQPVVTVTGIIPGKYLYFEIRHGPRGWVEIRGKEASVEFGASSLEIASEEPVSFYLLPPECNEIIEVALTKDPIFRAGPGEPVRVTHLLEGTYELRDREGMTVQTVKVGPGENRITLKAK